MAENYFLRPGYVSRAQPKYFLDDGGDVIWQPDVYAEAFQLGRRLGATTIVDVGCGDGRKLAAMYPRFQIIGIDFGPNLHACRARYPFGTWLEHDLEDAATPLPLSPDPDEPFLIVCSDVIEHLVRPEVLLEKLGAIFERSVGLVLSTPERELTWGLDHLGPPPNEAHVREWSLEELALLLQEHGLTAGEIGLTRSNTLTNQPHTILATLFPRSLGVATEMTVHASWKQALLAA